MDTVGIIGSGSFGITMAKIISRNKDVLLYSRKSEVVDVINNTHFHLGYPIRENITATSDIQRICDSCQLLVAVVPSSSFRQMIMSFSPFLKPSHIIIHATKGLDVSRISEEDYLNLKFSRKDVNTMSEIILQESNVVRVGCISGPNLSREILLGQPAAASIASEYDEVIKLGQSVMGSKKFFTFGSYDIKAAEIAGAFKNIIALASGILDGINMGKNMQSLLITRGLREMIYFGVAMGTDGAAYLGMAGIGDLIATATSTDSRNYTFGKRFASGEDFNHIMATSSEVVEGVRTLKIIHQLARNEKLTIPIVSLLHKVIFEGLDIHKALDLLMTDGQAVDVDFLKQNIKTFV